MGANGGLVGRWYGPARLLGPVPCIRVVPSTLPLSERDFSINIVRPPGMAREVVGESAPGDSGEDDAVAINLFLPFKIAPWLGDIPKKSSMLGEPSKSSARSRAGVDDDRPGVPRADPSSIKSVALLAFLRTGLPEDEDEPATAADNMADEAKGRESPRLGEGRIDRLAARLP